MFSSLKAHPDCIDNGNTIFTFYQTLPGNSFAVNYHFTSPSCKSQNVDATTNPAVV